MLWDFASFAREKSKEVLKLMGVPSAFGPVAVEAVAEDNETDALLEVTKIVQTVQGIMNRDAAPTVGELQAIICLTRRVEQLLKAVLQARLLSGSLAVLSFLFHRYIIILPKN